MMLTSRLYETEHDLQQMQGLLMEGRSRTDDWRYMHIGEMTFGILYGGLPLKSTRTHSSLVR